MCIRDDKLIVHNPIAASQKQWKSELTLKRRIGGLIISDITDQYAALNSPGECLHNRSPAGIVHSNLQRVRHIFNAFNQIILYGR